MLSRPTNRRPLSSWPPASGSLGLPPTSPSSPASCFLSLHTVKDTPQHHTPHLTHHSSHSKIHHTTQTLVAGYPVTTLFSFKQMSHTPFLPPPTPTRPTPSYPHLSLTPSLTPSPTLSLTPSCHSFLYTLPSHFPSHTPSLLHTLPHTLPSLCPLSVCTHYNGILQVSSGPSGLNMSLLLTRPSTNL